MDQVLLSYIEWGNEHWWFFGWTAFWSILMLLAGVFQTMRLVLFVLPNRLLRTIHVTKHGWPPEHLDADGDWRPLPSPGD
jgi:hypothetical protein